MNKRLATPLAAGTLALALVKAVLVAGRWLDAVLGHYPGALPTGSEPARMNANLSSDVVFAAAGPAGLQGLQAAAEQGAWVIGVDPADTVTFAPGQPGAEQWVTSVYFDLGAAVAAALEAFQAGTPLSGPQPLSAASGALTLAPYNVSEEDLTPLDRQDIAALIARLADGSLETSVDAVSGQER